MSQKTHTLQSWHGSEASRWREQYGEQVTDMILFVRQPAFNQTLLSCPFVTFLFPYCTWQWWLFLRLSVFLLASSSLVSNSLFLLRATLSFKRVTALSPLAVFFPPSHFFPHCLPSIKPQSGVAHNILLSKVTYRLELALFIFLIIYTHPKWTIYHNITAWF